MQEIDAYNDYDEDDDSQEIIVDSEVPRRGHGRSLSGKFNAITDLNALRKGTQGREVTSSNDYGSAEMDVDE